MVKRKAAIAVGVFCVITCVSVAVCMRTNTEVSNAISKEVQVERGNITVGITESGSVELGTVEQNYEIELSSDGDGSTQSATSQSGTASAEENNSVPSLTAQNGEVTVSNDNSSEGSGLEIAEVCVSEGQILEKEDPLFRLKKSSISAVKEQLEEQLQEAQLTLKNAKIEKKSKKVDARYTYEQNIAKGKSAKTTYQATLSSLQQNVSDAQAAVEEAESRMAEIPKEIKKLQKQKKTLQSSKNGTTAYAGEKMDPVSSENELGSTNLNDETQVGTQVQSSVSNSEGTIDSESSIASQIETLQNELDTVNKNYSNLLTQLSNAKSAQVTGKIEAKQTYEEALLNYKNAQEIYDITVDGLEDAVKDAKTQVSDAKEDCQLFEDFVKDGVVTSDYAGMVMSVGYEEGDVLNSNTAMVVISDADAVTMTVSVSQEDITDIAIGDSVNIVFTAYEDEEYQGTVQEVAASDTNSSSSTVDYDVTIKVEGDVEKLYEGMTGNVTFVTEEKKDVLCVSNKAIINEGTKSYVKKKEGENIEKVEVKTGFSNGVSVEIQEGLSEGDVVIIEGQVSDS